jgi:protein Mpv17
MWLFNRFTHANQHRRKLLYYILKTKITIKLRVCTDRLFVKYLFVTNIGVSVVASGLGDLIQQTYEIYAGYQDKFSKDRSLKIASASLPIAILCHYWYAFLDSRFNGHAKQLIIKKFLLDQIIAGPLIIVAFFVVLGLWNNNTSGKIFREITVKGLDIYKAEWCVWPVAQFINFYFLPPKFRMLYISIISLFFDVYFSYIAFKDKRSS